jgi:sugar/nucleoside kinase (ribokinase family)
LAEIIVNETNGSLDILGLGVIAVDDLIYVESYPAPDSKVRVLRRERQCGGLTATALVTAARLGCRCSYAGVLGYTDLSEFAVETLKREQISLSHLVRKQEARPVCSTIIVDEGRRSRNVFFDLDGVIGADDSLPEADLIRQAGVLFVDHVGVKGMIRASRIARAAGIAVVADFESDESPEFLDLLSLVDHLILSRDFATRITGESDAPSAVKKLWDRERKAVIVTCGEEGCWYLGDSLDCPVHQPAFSVKVLDTTGCGDVFHGAYASGLIQRLDLPGRVRYASAVAALKATQTGGQQGIPGRSEVEAFLKGRNWNEFRETCPRS